MANLKYTKELLAPIVKESKSISDCIRKLGLEVCGGTFGLIKKYIRHYDIDSSHFTGQGWAKGHNQKNDPRIEKQVKSYRSTDEEIFNENAAGWIKGDTLRKRMVEVGFEEKCGNCQLSEWLGSSIRLDIDHINGISNDNRRINLRFLCPNCHRQTNTWGNKKRIT